MTLISTQKKIIINTLIVTAAMCMVVGTAQADDDKEKKGNKGKTVKVEVFAPKKGDIAGIGSSGFVVDLVAEFKGDLASTGASVELTGPGLQANTGPFPGTFGLGANKDHFPGLVALLSTTTIGRGAGHNLSNLFNIVGVTHRDDEETYIWTTWIVGAPGFFGTVGEQTPSKLFIAIVAGGAPDVVEDMDANGVHDEKDLVMMGYKVLSNTSKIDFIVNGL